LLCLWSHNIGCSTTYSHNGQTACAKVASFVRICGNPHDYTLVHMAVRL
jgi:hypothetical protein